MAIDREDTLKKAEKLLRQGRLDAAIVEYRRVVEDYPRDWNTVNTLGDCLYRAHQVDGAVEQYTRIADHFAQEGFLPKAAALYKKVLKIKPDHDHALIRSADIAALQGTLVEARQFLASAAAGRRARGDARGATELLLRIGTLDPDDLDARLAAAKSAPATGDCSDLVAGELQDIAERLAQAGQATQSLEALEDALRLIPDNAALRERLARGWAAAGSLERARAHAVSAADFRDLAEIVEVRGDTAHLIELLTATLERDPEDRATVARLVRACAAAGDYATARVHLSALGEIDDVGLLPIAVEVHSRTGDHESARALLTRLLAREPHRAEGVLEQALGLAASESDGAFALLETVAGSWTARGDVGRASAAWRRFVDVQPAHVPALLRLVEACVDAGLDRELTQAQADLADAYLAAGQGAEARVVAEDLVSRAPTDQSHVDRLRRALVMAGEPDVEALIAERVTAADGLDAVDFGLDLNDEAEGSPSPAPAIEPDAPAVVVESPASGDEPPPRDRVPEVAGFQEPSGAAPQHASAAYEIEDIAAASSRPRAQPSQPPAERDPFGLSPIAIDLRDILGEDMEGASDAAPTPDGGEIDLNTALDELSATRRAALHPEPAPPPAGSLDEVFADFRQEVTRQSAADAAEQHYKVALAYCDMGMSKEAVKELEIAVRSPRLRFESASLLARLSLEAGRRDDAIEWFERAAEAPAPTLEAGRGLLYDLAEALEADGETARALAVFLELQADAPQYRDVGRRVERLTRIQESGG